MKINHVVIITSDLVNTSAIVKEIKSHLKKLHIKVTNFYIPFNVLIDPVLPNISIDFAIVVGGDGTALRAARVCAYRDIPILPIKVGNFGFINEIQADEWKEAFSELQEDNYKMGSYHLLEVVLGNASWLAVNDITLTSDSYGAISVDVYSKNELLTSYRADGVIISTPIGSTGHSLSVGGPLIAPDLHVCVINPIAPFTLSNRSIVLSLDSPFVVKVQKKQRHHAILVMDGRVMQGILPNGRFVVRDSKLKAHIVHSSKRSYFDILRNKLGWGGEFRA